MGYETASTLDVVDDRVAYELRTGAGREPRAVNDVEFELIAESIPHVVFMTSADGTTEYFNRRGTEYTGLPRSANAGWGWVSLLHPDDADVARQAWERAVACEQPFESEYRIRRADGEYRWHAGRALPIRNAEGQIVKWIGTCTDIEDQKSLERELRDAERQATESLLLLETLQSTAPVGFGFVDREFRFARVNETLAAINGIPVEEHLGRHVADVVPDLWSDIEPLYRHVLETGEALVNAEFSGETAADPGTIHYWLVSFHPVRLEEGVVGIGIAVVDITEHKRDENFRSAVMDNLAEGVYALDSEGRLLFMNSAAARMLGWREDELRGRQMHAAIHFQRSDGSPLPESECELLRVQTTGRSVRVNDDAFTRKDGSIIPVAYSAAPLLYGSNGSGVHGVVAVFRDTTDEKVQQLQMQRELDTLSWVGRIRDALDEDRFVLYSQPIVPLGVHEPREELLIRMIGRDDEVFRPGAFLPAAEKFGLIGEIDRWVVTTAVRLAASGRRVQANLSAESIANEDLLPLIERELRSGGCDPANLVLEVTETALMRDVEAGRRLAEGLLEIGCGLALDDFGTGFGSFTYLKELPASYLKIDADFVHDLASNPANQHLVKAIVDLARGFGCRTIAEGVEDEETVVLLRQYGVDYAQGFHVGRPHPLAHIWLG